MGQKTNPNIFRLGSNKNYFYRHLEKKSSELPLCDFNLLEIKKFTYQFFKNNNLELNNCKISYSHNNILRFFISYYATPLYTTKSYKNKQTNKKLEKLIKPYFYSNFLYSSKLRTRRIQVKNLNFFKIKLRKLYLNQERFNKNFLLKKTFLKTKSNYFLNDFCDSILKFLNKNIKISIICNQLNSNEIKKLDLNTVELLKKSVSSLFYFTRFKFYKDGINTLFLCAQRPDCTYLLTNYIANNLPNQKNHINFLKFVIQTLLAFKKNKFSKIETIRIKLKGRINRKPRARHQFFQIGNKRLLPILSINSKINFSEKVSFTANGTLGLKVWSLGKNKKVKKSVSKKKCFLYSKFNLLKTIEPKSTNDSEKKLNPFLIKNYKKKPFSFVHKQQNSKFSTVSRISFGEVAIVASQKGFINKIQLEATKLAIKRILKREGKVWQKALPHVIVTSKSKGARMGKGKGKIKYSTYYVKKIGTILFEVTGNKRSTVLKALLIGKTKLPIKTFIVG